MNQATHPSTELLAGYVASPESTDYNELRQHLSHCTECRNQTMKLSQLNHNIAHVLPRYLTYKANSIYKANGIHEANDHNDLKSALHFATHSAAMERHFNESSIHATIHWTTTNTTPNSGRNGKESNVTKGFIEKISDFLSDVLTAAPPVWVSVPVTAALVFSITLMFTPVSNKTEMTIVAYQDNPVIVFETLLDNTNQVPPGIGFFSAAKHQSEPFNSISIALTDNSILHLKWSPIRNAISYIINLYLIDGADRKLIGEVSAKTAEAVFSKSNLQPGRRYEWLITGKTKTNLSFQTQGGFVVAQ